MNRRPPFAIASLLALFTASRGLAQDSVGAWLDERAKEYGAHLAASATPPAPPEDDTRLWQERLGPPSLPQFVPPTSWAPLLKEVSPTVVNISIVSGAAGSAEDPARRSLGSGFLISADGYVVTNNHVVERAQRIFVRLSDGRERVATVVGRDPSTDVALLKLQTDAAQKLPFAYLGDSDKLEVGDWVAAIGNPFGLARSVSHGMISAKERVLGVGVFDDFIQTDALINPGNSGGPLFNMRGEVVGVNTAIVSQAQGIGFAVPINMVKELLPNLRRNGRLARGWLGVNIQEQPSGDVKTAVVQEVFANSPAAKVGIRVGDRVIAVNGRNTESYLGLLRRIAILAPGSTTRLTIERDGKRREVQVLLAERPAPESLELVKKGSSQAAMGLWVKDLDPKAAARLGVARGVVVVGVLPGSPAEQAGLLAQDLILEVNQREVTTVRAYEEALKLSTHGTALLRVQRGENVRWVAVPLG